MREFQPTSYPPVGMVLPVDESTVPTGLPVHESTVPTGLPVHEPTNKDAYLVFIENVTQFLTLRRGCSIYDRVLQEFEKQKLNNDRRLRLWVSVREFRKVNGDDAEIVDFPLNDVFEFVDNMIRDTFCPSLELSGTVSQENLQSETDAYTVFIQDVKTFLHARKGCDIYAHVLRVFESNTFDTHEFFTTKKIDLQSKKAENVTVGERIWHKFEFVDYMIRSIYYAVQTKTPPEPHFQTHYPAEMRTPQTQLPGRDANKVENMTTFSPASQGLTLVLGLGLVFVFGPRLKMNERTP